MAKLNHVLFGQAKGKVGGLVLQRYEGMNIAREKPISVKNPQSAAQTTQRGKLKLASQIVAQFSEVLTLRLSPLSAYQRIRRGAAVSAIAKAISGAQPENPSILVAEVGDAINAKSISGLPAPAVTISNNAFSIIAANGDTCRYAICNYDADGILISKETETFTSDGTEKTVTPEAGFVSSVLMAVSYHATTEAGRAIISNTGVDSNVFSLDISRGVNAGDIEVTNLKALAYLGI